MNIKIPRPWTTRNLIAPELRDAVKMLPTVECNDELIRAFREQPLDVERLQRAPMPPSIRAVRCEQRMIPGPVGAPDVRILIYTPPECADQPRPVLLHIHGGGFIIGAPEFNDLINREQAAQLNCTVVSVAYRLAPETTYPGPVEDCYAALKWINREAESLGVDPQRIAVGGESAGAGLAALLAIKTRDRGEMPICLQLLDSPMLDDCTGAGASRHPYCGEFVWTHSSNQFGWKSMLGVEPGTNEVPTEAVPARHEDLSNLPPAFMVVGMLDLFLEETLEYARRLVRAGVSTELHVVPGAFHGFPMASRGTPQVENYHSWRRQALSRAWAR